MRATFDIHAEGTERVLTLLGDWTVWTVADVDPALRALAAEDPSALTIDVSRLGRMDVAGAWLVERTAQTGDGPFKVRGAHDVAGRLFATVHASVRKPVEPQAPLTGLIAVLDGFGRSMASLREETLHTLDFLGYTLVTLWRVLRHPKRLRWLSVVSVMETAGLNAMPIIGMLSFFIGVVVAFLGSRVLGDFGVSVFTVELVAFSVLREFGIVITAVLLAGRTASAFTAEIGAMKMRQEIDAMRVLGIDPMEAIVVPRVLAMVVMTPILTFVAVVAGLVGGLLVCWALLNVSPVMFVTRIHDGVPVQHFWVGMIKAPVMAFVLAIVGCRHGLETGGDVTSLGRRVTSAVVQSIFLVIIIDALFAIWFLEMDW